MLSTFKLSEKIFSFKKRTLSFFKRLLIVFLFILMMPYLMMPTLYLWTPPSTLMLARYASLQPVIQQNIPLESISPHLINAVLASEDGKFCAHKGIDWRALNTQIDKALKGKQSRGASTITMQTIKNIFLWPSRSYLRKAYEIPLALWADLILTKRRILSLYLNIAEWDEGVFGIEAASQHYFQQSAQKINKIQAARLATTLPNPKKRNAHTPSQGHRKLSAINVKRAQQMGPYLHCLTP